MQYQIKKLNYDDIEKYEIQLKKHIQNLMEPYIDKELNNETERIYSNMKKFTEDNTAVILGAFDNENLIGFIWGYKKLNDLSIFHINYFYVDDNFRKSGIGTQLLLNIEKEFKNCREIELLVFKKNINAINFYENRKFKIKEELVNAIKLKKEVEIND